MRPGAGSITRPTSISFSSIVFRIAEGVATSSSRNSVRSERKIGGGNRSRPLPRCRAERAQLFLGVPPHRVEGRHDGAVDSARMIKQLLTSRGRRRAAADSVYQTNPKPSLELPYLKAHRRL